MSGHDDQIQAPPLTPEQIAEDDANVREALREAGFTAEQVAAHQAALDEARRTGRPVRADWFKGDWARQPTTD